MANANTPRGFMPVKTKSGTGIVTNPYTIASTYGYDIGRGEPVMLTGTGNNIQLAIGSAGTPTPDGLGIFAGCFYTDAKGKPTWSHYWPASTVATDAIAYVWDDPQIVFEVQSATCALNDLGALADFTAGTMNAVTKQSGSYLQGSVATTARTFRIERFVDRPDNAAGAYAKVEVIYAEHCRLGVISAVGGM